MNKLRSPVAVSARRLRFSGVLIALVTLVTAGSAGAGILTNQLAAKAQPDECFVGIGSTGNLPLGPSCSGTPKVNQAYVWGLTESGSKLWFGTAANVQCLVLQGYIGFTTPIQTPSYVCEFGKNPYYHSDWRPPKIYSYDLNHHNLTDRSAAAANLSLTLGIRSAGSHGNVILLGGPSLDLHGIYLFAFKANGTYLGSTKLTQYTDIRQWIAYKGHLYTGVQAADGSGRILRWTGNQSNPFQFEEVGETDAEVAYFASQGGRLYATTWGGANAHGNPSGLWASPKRGVLTSADLMNWQEIWNVDDYEVDPVTAQTLVGGAVASYKGKLYWGLMQVPFTGVLGHYIAYPGAPMGGLNTLLAIVATTRAIPIFRTNGNPDHTRTELLYGGRFLPVYDPGSQSWKLVPNASGQSPRFGRAGFGNPFNTYTWAASVYADRLFFGTFDWSYLLADGLPLIIKELGLGAVSLGPLMDSFGPLDSLGGSLFSRFTGGSSDPIDLTANKFLQKHLYGADLWRFDSPNRRARPENVTGLGNYLNYGIRTMISDSRHLYAGMADPMNLKTVPGEPDGGWELRILTYKHKGKGKDKDKDKDKDRD